MRLKLTLLTTLLLVVAKSWGWSVGDQFTVSGITYQINDLTDNNYNVTAIAVSTDALVEGTNKVIIPATVKDPYDASKTFTITKLSIAGTNNEKIQVLELAQGDVDVWVTSLAGAHFDEVILPSNVSFIQAGDGYVKSFTFQEGSKFYVDSEDGEVYKTLDKGGVELVYHFRENTKRIKDGVYEIKEGVTFVRTANFCVSDITRIKLSSKVTGFIHTGTPKLGHTNIVEYLVDEDNPKYTAINGVLYDKNVTTLYIYPAGKSTKDETFPIYKVPDTVTEVLGHSLTRFKGTEIDLNNVAYVGAMGITRTDAETLKIGKYLQILSGISDNYKIANIIIDENNPYMKSYDGVIFNKDKTTLIQCPIAKTGAYTLPDGVTKIDNAAFRKSSITSFTGNESLTDIGTYAFYAAKVTSIDFNKCVNLKKVGSYAFGNIKGMTEFTVPASLEEICTDIFAESPFVKVTIPAGSQLNTIHTSAFNRMTYFTTLEIDPNCPLVTIETKAFYGCKGLTSITLPKTVTTIGASAFSGCTALEKVTFAENADIKSIGANAFEFSGIKSISIPEGVTTIGKEAFSTCDVLTEVTLPSTLASMSGEAFKFCI